MKLILYIVYQVKNIDLQQLKTRKEDVIATVTHNILPKVSKKKVENHLDVCHATSGAHIEIS